MIGFLSKFWVLLQVPSCTVLVSRCLSKVVEYCHEDIEFSRAVFSQTPTFLRLLGLYPSISETFGKLSEALIPVLARTVGPVVQKANRNILQSLNIRELLDIVGEAMFVLNSSFCFVLRHGINFIASLTSHFKDEILVSPKIILMLVACLRSTFLPTRFLALQVLSNLAPWVPPNGPYDIALARLLRAESALKDFRTKLPEEEREQIEDYGVDRLDASATMRAKKSYWNELQLLAKMEEKDYYAFGKKIAPFIESTPVCLPNDECKDGWDGRG